MQTEASQLKYAFEGQDVDCNDTTAGQAVPNVTFTVTGDTASQT